MALAYFMAEHKVFPLNTDIQEALDFYFQASGRATVTEYRTKVFSILFFARQMFQ